MLVSIAPLAREKSALIGEHFAECTTTLGGSSDRKTFRNKDAEPLYFEPVEPVGTQMISAMPLEACTPDTALGSGKFTHLRNSRLSRAGILRSHASPSRSAAIAGVLGQCPQSSTKHVKVWSKRAAKRELGGGGGELPGST